MLTQLKPKAYGTVSSLFEPLRYNLVVDSIIAGHTPAWVFVDRVENPGAALMWNRQDAMLIAGDATDTAFSEAAGAIILHRIIPDAQSRYVPALTLHYDTEGWLAHRRRLLGERETELAARRCYEFDHPVYDWRSAMPAGFEMQPMTVSLLQDRSVKNIEHAVGWVRSYWRSLEDFTETSFGYALVQQVPDAVSTVTSWCLAVYVSGDAYELGLATMSDYRRQGHGTLVAGASVEYCHVRDATPHWHCNDTNAGSLAIAEKVGFTNPTFYTVLRFDI